MPSLIYSKILIATQIALKINLKHTHTQIASQRSFVLKNMEPAQIICPLYVFMNGYNWVTHS